MDTYDQEVYKKLEEVLEKNRVAKANLMLVSIPGLGVSHLLKCYANRHNKEGVRYIYQEGQLLGDFNLIDLGFDLNPKAREIAENYFRMADVNQKIVLSVTDPSLLRNEEFKKSYFYNHIYSTHWLTTVSDEDGKCIAHMFNPDLINEDIKRILMQSLGLPQVIKFLAINPTLEDIDESVDGEHILLPIQKIVNKLHQDELELLKIRRESWLAGTNNKNFDLEINFDLSLKEKGKETGVRLTPEEKKIIEKMTTNQGIVTKEEVAEIKWGEGTYDKFSDQAINKAMRRLAEKLKVYTIETVPRVGYRLQE